MNESLRGAVVGFLTLVCACAWGGDVVQPALPCGYASLAYIGSTAVNQGMYVDTLVHPSEKMRVEIGLQIPESATYDNKYFMGMIEQVSQNVYSRFHIGVDSSKQFIVHLRNCSGSVLPDKTEDAYGWHTLTMDARTSIAYLDEASQETVVKVPNSDATASLKPANNSTFWLFGRNSKSVVASGLWVRISGAKIWDGYQMVRELVPCERLSDGRLGMYDLVSGSFLPCEGAEMEQIDKGPRIGFFVKPIRPVVYAGTETKQPLVTVTAVAGRRPLIMGTDYELVFENAAEPGQAMVEVRGLGDFAGQNLCARYWIVPKLPKGYTALQSIRSTGTQYIDVGCTVGDTTEFQAHVYMENTMNPGPDSGNDKFRSPLGVRSAEAGNELRVTPRFNTASEGGTISSDQTRTYAHGGSHMEVAWGSRLNAWEEVLPFADHEMVISLRTKGEAKVLSYNDSYPWEFTPSGESFRTTDNLYLFCFNDHKGTASGAVHLAYMRMWGFRLWDKEGDTVVLKRDMVPCRRESDGLVGLYDLAATGDAKRFYGSFAKGTNFEAGEEMPEVPARGLVVFFR